MYNEKQRNYTQKIDAYTENWGTLPKAEIRKPHANNNRIESLNGTLREHVKVQKGWKSMETPITRRSRTHYNFAKPHLRLEGIILGQRSWNPD